MIFTKSLKKQTLTNILKAAFEPRFKDINKIIEKELKKDLEEKHGRFFDALKDDYLKDLINQRGKNETKKKTSKH